MKRRVAVVTGSRAEFGLLRPVMHAIHQHSSLELAVIASGSHLVLPAETYRDVKREFAIADTVPMQIAGRVGRAEDAESVARGVARFSRAFARLEPAWVLVLGDRIEVLAAAVAASVGGLALAHIHGGDRAEGIADEAMRHAVTKLAHLHFAATAQSADRIRRMGEPPDRIHTVGSPAIDGLRDIAPLDDARFAELGSPTAVLLMHPTGRTPATEAAAASAALSALHGERVLALHPNLDPGRDGIMQAITQAAASNSGVQVRSHLHRDQFVGLLKRLANPSPGTPQGVMVGNSSAALIECAALGVRVVDIGVRQNGRERFANAVHVSDETHGAIRKGFEDARALSGPFDHGYGDGRSGYRVAEALAATDSTVQGFLRKQNTY